MRILMLGLDAAGKTSILYNFVSLMMLLAVTETVVSSVALPRVNSRGLCTVNEYPSLRWWCFSLLFPPSADLFSNLEVFDYDFHCFLQFPNADVLIIRFKEVRMNFSSHTCLIIIHNDCDF